MSRQQTLVQIDPGRALCWEPGDTIRVGFDRGHVRIPALAAEAQRVFRALLHGMPEARFTGLLARAGPDQHGVRELLRTLEPVLVRFSQSANQRVTHQASGHEETEHPEARPHEAGNQGVPLRKGARRQKVDRAGRTRILPPSAIRAQLHDDGRPVPGLQSSLEANWLCRFERSDAPPELAVQVVRFLEPLERTRRWLGAGIPHLVIRLTDDALRIGPIVAAAGFPCHGCEALHLVDSDPVLPSLAVQLYGRRPGSETNANGQLIGALSAQIVRAWRGGATWVHHSQLVLPITRYEVSGLATIHTIAPHPECGCAIEAVLSGESLLPSQTEKGFAVPAQSRQTPKPEERHEPG